MDYNKIPVKKIETKDKNVELKKREAVVKGKETKPSLLSRAGNLFFGEDGFRGIANHLVHEVFIPSIQNTISDVATSAIQRAIFGDNYSIRRSRDYWDGGRRYVSSRMDSGYGRGRVAYDKQYEKNRSRKSENVSNTVRMIEFDTADDAREVLSVMLDTIDQYGLVTVADFYELSDVASKFTDHQYGWTDLSDVAIVALRGGGYGIDWPPVETV